MFRAARSVPAVVALLIVFATPSVALAASASWQSIDVTLQAEKSGSMLLVSGELPANVSLPADVELSVPAGAEIRWIGEILGGPVADDPELKYVKSSANGADVYRFTLTKARVAQVEAIAPGVGTSDGLTYATSLKWIASQDVPSVRISARVQQGAKIAQASPGASLLPGDAGFSYYSKTVTDVKAGSPVDLAFSYTLPVAGQSATTTAGSGSQDIIPLVLIVVLVGGGLVAMAIGVQRKLASKSATREAAEPQMKGKSGAGAKAGASAVAAASQAESASSAEKRRGAQVRRVVTAVIVLGLVGAIVAIGRQATSSDFVNGKLTRSFGGVSPCTNVTIPLIPNQGVDLEASGGRLMDALKGLESVGDVTITLKPASIYVPFCESSLTEAAVRDALTSAGIVTLGPSAAQASEPTTATPN